MQTTYVVRGVLSLYLAAFFTEVFHRTFERHPHMSNLPSDTYPVSVTKLSETRKSDRPKMAGLVADLAVTRNCSVSVTTGGDYPGPRRTIVGIKAPGGLCLGVDFDGDSSQPNVHVLSWNVALGSPAKLSPSVFGQGINPYHFRKATDVAHGMLELLDILDFRLAQAENGTAYQAATHVPPLRPEVALPLTA